MVGRYFLFIIFLFSLFPNSAHGITLFKNKIFSFDFSGYYKNLAFTSKEQDNGDPYFADLNRLRTEWDLSLYDIFSIKVIWDNEIVVGDFVNTPDFNRFLAARKGPYLDLENEIVRTDNFYYGMGLYRAYFRIDVEPMAMIVGKQKVDWGTMRLVSPTALFTPVTVFDIEKDEIPGTTAVNLIFTLNNGLKINSVYTIHSDFDQSRLGLRITKSVGKFDVSALGGRFLKDVIVGFDFSGEVKGMGIRGEFLYDISPNNEDFLQFAIELDYAFKKVYLDFEYLFNGQGNNSSPTSNGGALSFFGGPNTGNQVKSYHQNFIGLFLKYDITPLLSFMMWDVMDINGVSFFINPEIKYSAFSWIDFLAGVQIQTGKSGGEFSDLPNVYYFQTQMYF